MRLQGNWLARSWCQRGPTACLLWPLSMLYGLVTGCHRLLYVLGILKADICAVPVIVVGNVVAGGAGKTPLVIALAKRLLQQGLRVGVVSRGYGRQTKGSLEVLENTSISSSGDEPALILRAIKHADFSAPVFVANRRIHAVRDLLKKYPATQVIISDDGLQHHAMARDIEITVFDDRGIGNGWLLPAGPLREHWPNRRQNSLVLHTGQSPAFKGFKSVRRLASHAINQAGAQVGLISFKDQELTALAGIAHPDAFFDMLRAAGLTLKSTISLPDHFDFEGFELPASPAHAVLCTEKDAIKLFKHHNINQRKLLAVPLEFAPEPAFLSAIDALLVPLIAKAAEKSSELPSHFGVENGNKTA